MPNEPSVSEHPPPSRSPDQGRTICRGTRTNPDRAPQRLGLDAASIIQVFVNTMEPFTPWRAFATHVHREGVIMPNKRLPLAILTMALALPLLAACNTTAGAGQDISATGHAVTKAATNATP
jgi:predicted small secreted protein